MTFEGYLEEISLQHMRPATIKNARLVLGNLNKFKPLDDCTEADLKNYFTKYKSDFKEKNGKPAEESSIIAKYSVVRKYYRWMGKLDVIKWIKTKNIIKKINPNKLLTPAEIQTMLRLWQNDRDKCLLAIAYESGMRIGELLSLSVSDLTIENGECKLRIPDNSEGEHITSKTGSRTLVLIESMPYIEKHLSFFEGNGRLFNIQKTRAHYIIKDMAKRAGIENKVVYWHLLRHTRATEMARLGMQETAMKKRFGWTEDSGMIKRYTSLTDEDADNSYREALGLGIKKKDIAINPIARRCAKCGKLVETGEYCPQCSEIQKLTEANTKAQIGRAHV
jgi:integrase/recombinase XerD